MNEWPSGLPFGQGWELGWQKFMWWWSQFGLRLAVPWVTEQVMCIDFNLRSITISIPFLCVQAGMCS